MKGGWRAKGGQAAVYVLMPYSEAEDALRQVAELEQAM